MSHSDAIYGASRKRARGEAATDVSSTNQIPQSFVSRLSDMTQNANTLSDFTITCGDRSWKVHRVILHLHSPVLGKACTGNFQEAHNATINLSEDPAIAVEAMIEYMYNFDYDICFSLSQTPTLSAHVEVAIIADKYDIPALHRLATEKVDRILGQENADNVELTEAAAVAYDAPGPTAEIRRSIAIAAVCQPEVFFTNDAQESPFSKLMDKQPMLAKDIALAAVASASTAPEHSCPDCGHTLASWAPAGSTMLCLGCYSSFNI